MAKTHEEKLKREAVKKALAGERKGAYAYGTMQDMGMMGKKSHKKKMKKKMAKKRMMEMKDMD